MKAKILGLFLAALAASPVASAQSEKPVSPDDTRFKLAPTISPEATKGLEAVFSAWRQLPPMPQPKSNKDWAQINTFANAFLEPLGKKNAADLGVSTKADVIGGVPVIRIYPASFKPNPRAIVYVHGGAYTFFSAASTLTSPALMAANTGYEVISVDYTVAPEGNWRSITDQVVAVWRGLLANGKKAGDLAVAGDSAGGGLAAGTALKLRDLNLPLPGALYLMSPWTDVTLTGDTYITLAKDDPNLDMKQIVWSADAYADRADQKHPYVSPVYGDFARPYPPTLIQVGTREILLSDSVRLYDNIRKGGHVAVLDAYEGMPHVFQSSLPTTPETKTAMTRLAEFLKTHLHRR